MKKNVLRVAQAALILAVGFSACKKDELTNRESEAIRLTRTLPDSLNKDVEYTVNLVDASTANFVGKTAADFAGAVITASQGGNVSTMTAGTDGMVVFQGMQRGTMSVNIQMEGFASVDYTMAVATGYQGNLIPMIPTTGESNATISGTVYLETDVTNATKEVANAVEIFAIPDVGASALGDAIDGAGFSAFSYDGLSMSTTSDASGAYSIEVPAAADAIDYKLTVSHFTADQTIVMETVNGADVTGVQTIPTAFGSGIDLTGVSDIPNLAGAYAVISAPNSAITQEAVVTAVIDNPGGISEFVLESNGVGYNLPDDDFPYSFIVNEAGNAATDLEAVANLYVDNATGRMIESYMNAEGEGFTAVSSEDVEMEQASFDGEIDFIGGDDVAYVTINRYGEYLMDPTTADGTPRFTVKVEGVAVLTADVINLFQGDYEGNNTWGIEFDLDEAAANGFVAGDEVTVELNTAGTTAAKGNTQLTTGSVSAIAFTTVGQGYTEGTYDLLIEGGEGTGAAARAFVDADGVMYTAEVTAGGTGYTSAPTVSVLVDATAAGTQATATVAVNADGTIGAIDIDEAGAGYGSNPTITISSHLGNGSGATATVITDGDMVTDIVVTNTGSGYAEDANQATKLQAAEMEVATVTAGGALILDIDLGTGKRSIDN